jgi:hypothetical protein
MVNKIFKKSKNKKLIKRNKISRKLLRGGDQGLKKIENIQVDRIPNGIFKKMDSYISNNISNNINKENARLIKLLLSRLLKKNYSIGEAKDLDNNYLQNHADKNKKFCWYVIDKENLYVDIIFKEKEYGWEWYLSHEPNQIMEHLRFRGTLYNYNYSLIYYYKIDNDKHLLFRVDVNVINEKVSFEIFLLDEKGNNITIPPVKIQPVTIPVDNITRPVDNITRPKDAGYINIRPN